MSVSSSHDQKITFFVISQRSFIGRADWCGPSVSAEYGTAIKKFRLYQGEGVGLSMMSSIGWIDYDETERDRAQRLMDLFREQDSRDELGLGAIRDSIADHLFPGTSTIHTRLRYMLFIPWIFQSLPKLHDPMKIENQAVSSELQLCKALIAGAPRAIGIIGKEAGDDLKRLPSSVYWSALESWGIRQFQGSIDNYYKSWPVGIADHSKDNADDDFSGMQRAASYWNERLPVPPKGWLEKVTFELTSEEKSFLIDRLVDQHPDSLLTYLARRSDRPQADAIWLHPHVADFPRGAKILVQHARIFSDVMHGASLLYNLLLSQLRNHGEWTKRYEDALAAWKAAFNFSELNSWSLDDFWRDTQHKAHQVHQPARQFVTRWVSLLREKGDLEANMEVASRLIIDRETKLKASQSRFANKSARDRWGGASGATRLQFRWPIARTLLEDLHP